MVDWKKLFQPVKDGAERLPLLVRRVVATPPTPELEEFVSPLQETLKERLGVKDAIGYNRTCANCTRHKNIDHEMLETVETAADPEPWLAQLHGELIDTRAELTHTRHELAASKQYYTPQNRMKWAVYGAAASGGATTTIILLRYATEWAIQNLPQYMPFLIPSIFRLLGLM